MIMKSRALQSVPKPRAKERNPEREREEQGECGQERERAIEGDSDLDILFIHTHSARLEQKPLAEHSSSTSRQGPPSLPPASRPRHDCALPCTAPPTQGGTGAPPCGT